MVRAGLFESNQHEDICCCAVETSAEVYRCKLYSALDSNSHQFAWYGKNPRIHELRTFGCDIYLITSSPKSYMIEHKKDSTGIITASELQ